MPISRPSTRSRSRRAHIIDRPADLFSPRRSIARSPGASTSAGVRSRIAAPISRAAWESSARRAGLGLADAIEAASGFPVPQEAKIGLGYKLNSVVETVGVEVGWIWNPWRDLTVRVSFAFASAVGAQVSIKPNFLATKQQFFTRFAEDYMEDPDQEVPSSSRRWELAVGWRVF